MLALEEKNNLSNELQSTKKRLEEIGNQKVNSVTVESIMSILITYWPHTTVVIDIHRSRVIFGAGKQLISNFSILSFH